MIRVGLPVIVIFALGSAASAQVPALAEGTAVGWRGTNQTIRSWDGPCASDQALLTGNPTPFCVPKAELIPNPTTNPPPDIRSRILPEGHPRRWGGLDLLVGRTFVQRKSMFGGMNYSRTYRWVNPDRVLAVDWNIEGTTGTELWEVDPQTGFVQGHYMLEDGSIVTGSALVDGSLVRSLTKILSDNTFETYLQRQRNGRWITPDRGKETFESRQLIQMRQEERDAFWNGAFQLLTGASAAYAQVAAEQDGYQTGGGAGSVETVVGAALNGAAMATDNEMSRRVLAGQGDAMIASAAERSSNQTLPATVPPAGSQSDGGQRRSTPPGPSQRVEASSRQPPLHYTCNISDREGRVMYWSQTFTRSREGYYDRVRSYEAGWRNYVANRYGGSLSPGSCWSSVDAQEAAGMVESGKQFATSQSGLRNVDDDDWLPQSD